MGAAKDSAIASLKAEVGSRPNISPQHTVADAAEAAAAAAGGEPPPTRMHFGGLADGSLADGRRRLGATALGETCSSSAAAAVAAAVSRRRLASMIKESWRDHFRYVNEPFFP